MALTHLDQADWDVILVLAGNKGLFTTGAYGMIMDNHG